MTLAAVRYEVNRSGRGGCLSTVSAIVPIAICRSPGNRDRKEMVMTYTDRSSSGRAGCAHAHLFGEQAIRHEAVIQHKWRLLQIDGA